MSKHNWRERIASFITGRSIKSARPLSFWDINRFLVSATASVFCLYFLVVSGLGIWSWYEQNREERYEYHQRAANDQRQATQKIATSCAVPGAPADFVSMCLAREIDAYRARTTGDEDLQAQQEMARWTAITGTVSIVGVPLSVAGLFALWLSLRQTRQAISIDREVGHAQVRAYL
ncbi:hypothetical protein MPL3365_100150 [Mesorhizobium plurifarium]|uniref:Uncharacterized protein n=1 Tax=Mesorhizobium plurifarium TaxID=69974 RepID=A0A090FU54_MESPL|nr:hypothetical protein MPL3365_100150 [Mesorhizobium plurifarium]